MAINLYVATFLVSVATFICAVVVPFLWRSYRLRWKLMKLFPVLEGNHWLLGDLNSFPGMNEDGLLWNIKCVAKNPRYYLLSIGAIRSVIQLQHPETIKQLTKTTEPKQMSGGGGYSPFLPWIGDGLLTSSGKKWARNRRLLTPGFHFDVLKPYVDVYNDCMDILLERFKTESSAINKSIDIMKPVGQCALDIILRCAFSSTRRVQGKGEETYVNNVAALTTECVRRVMNPVLHPDVIYYLTSGGRQFVKNCNYSHNVAKEVIDKRRKILSESATLQDITKKGRYVDFLDILLLAKDEDGNGLSAQDILDEVETFMFEGHDTTASGISWILYNMARHPDYQAKARQEIDALLEDRESDRLQWKDMAELPYLTRCIKESLRLHTAVPFVGREIQNPVQIDDKVIPAGTHVDINIWNLHHNPAVWKEPMKYDPDRFLSENMAKMDSHAFMPFSAGPRNCIGQNFAMNEMKTTTARVLRQFELSVDTSKEVKMRPDAVLRSESGIHLFFHSRN